jgi:hypothetical protein
MKAPKPRQCEQYGDGHFRADQSKPRCGFRTFTEATEEIAELVRVRRRAEDAR